MRAVLLVIAAVVLFKIFYIFHCVAYLSSVQNDMASYWHGAFDRAWGNKFSFTQYGVCPPFFIYLCAYLLHLMNSFSLLSCSIPVVVVLNVLLHGLSSYFVYVIVHRMTERKILAWGALLFYCFSYTQLYLNALVLPDNLATPLLVIVVWFIAFGELKLWAVLGAGLLLGIAIASKPIFVILSPVFVVYLFLRSTKKDSLLLACVLSIGLILIPLVTVIENYHISSGRVLSLGPSGGANFYQGWGQVGKVTTYGQFGTWWLYSPGALDETNWKPVDTSDPWFHQGYYYQRGMQAIIKDPSVLFKKIIWFKKLFWGILAPSLSKQPPNFYRIMPIVQWGLYIMFLCPWVLCFSALRKCCDRTIFFFFTVLSVFFLSIYLYGMPERRYLSYIEFLIIILFFIAIDKVISLYKAYKSEVLIYIICVFSFFICVPLTWEHLTRLLN